MFFIRFLVWFGPVSCFWW